jgi:WD40 repeat protein
MHRARFVAVILFVPSLLFAGSQQTGTQDSAKSFPWPDFVFRDTESKPAKSGVSFGAMQSDGKGGTTGTFAVRRGASLGYVSSLSFSGDGRVLAVRSTPSRVDIWDVDSQRKVRSLQGGDTIALSSDGRLLAEDGNGIELWDVATGKLEKTILRELETFEPGSQNTIRSMAFNPAGTLLDVTANGEADSVYDVTTGQPVATLAHAQGSQFSRDGTLLIGGNAKYLAVWRTKDGTKVCEVPNVPDYLTRIAASPEKDLVVIGGPNGARLMRLSCGEEIARVGSGYTNFAAFNQSGTLLFTYSKSGFAVWDDSGKLYCSRADFGDGIVALSSDDRRLAAAPINGARTVMLWNLQKALDICNVPASTKDH